MERRSSLALGVLLGLGLLGLLLWREERDESRWTPGLPEQAPPEPELPGIGEGPEVRRVVGGESSGPECAAIRVFVCDLERAPVPGARVRTTDDAHAEATTDELGRCVLSHPAQAVLGLEATASGFLGLKDEVRWAEEITLELPRACTVSGRVLDADTREPIAGANGTTLSDRFVIFNDGRRTRLVGLSPGEWRFKAFPAGIVIEPESVVLPREGPLRIRWRFE